MLTNATAEKAKPRDKPYKLYDSGGLFLMVTPAGGKLWRMRYILAGKEKLLSFGPFPEVTITAARDARDAARAHLRALRDPSLVRKVLRASAADSDRKFETVARDWHELHKGKWAERHAANVLGSLEADVFPRLGSCDVREITAPMVLDVLRRIEARPAIETARRVRQRISAVFTHAISCGLAEADPAALVKGALAPLVKGRQPALVDLVAVRQMLVDAESIPAHPVTKLALRFIALTACRPNEVAGARWTEMLELDGPAPAWLIPAARMKGRMETKREHLVPLSTQAVEVVQAVHELTGRMPFLFPSSRSSQKPMSENALGYLLNRAGYHHRHVPHGWRAAFSTIMNEASPADRAVIDLMLAHVPYNKTEAAYNRAAHMARRRELAQLWADMLMAGMAPASALLEGPRR
jgi:integrase